MSAKTVRCPYCGSQFSVPTTVSIAVCPYCGTTIWLATREVFKEHYIYPVRYEYNKAYDTLIGIAERQFAAPETLREESAPSGGLIHYVPLYLYHVKVVASCPNKEEAGLEEAWVSRLATSSPPKGLHGGYRFPSRGRRYFEPKTLKRGKYYQPDLDPKKYIPEVSARASLKALREAYNWCDEPQVNNKTSWEGIVHYPFWEVTYKYRGQEYYGLVDAVDGTVLYVEYPVGSKKRSVLLAGATGILIGGTLIGLGLGYAIGAAAAGAGGGLIASLPGVFNYMRQGVARRLVYKLGGRSEE